MVGHRKKARTGSLSHPGSESTESLKLPLPSLPPKSQGQERAEENPGQGTRVTVGLTRLFFLSGNCPDLGIGNKLLGLVAGLRLAPVEV